MIIITTSFGHQFTLLLLLLMMLLLLLAGRVATSVLLLEVDAQSLLEAGHVFVVAVGCDNVEFLDLLHRFECLTRLDDELSVVMLECDVMFAVDVEQRPLRWWRQPRRVVDVGGHENVCGGNNKENCVQMCFGLELCLKWHFSPFNVLFRKLTSYCLTATNNFERTEAVFLVVGDRRS